MPQDLKGIVEGGAAAVTVDITHAVTKKSMTQKIPTEALEGTIIAVGAAHVLDLDLLTVTDTIDLLVDVEMRTSVGIGALVDSVTVHEGGHLALNLSLPHRSRQKMNAIAGPYSCNSSPPDLGPKSSLLSSKRLDQ